MLSRALLRDVFMPVGVKEFDRENKSYLTIDPGIADIIIVSIQKSLPRA